MNDNLLDRANAHPDMYCLIYPETESTLYAWKKERLMTDFYKRVLKEGGCKAWLVYPHQQNIEKLEEQAL